MSHWQLIGDWFQASRATKDGDLGTGQYPDYNTDLPDDTEGHRLPCGTETQTALISEMSDPDNLKTMCTVLRGGFCAERDPDVCFPLPSVGHLPGLPSAEISPLILPVTWHCKGVRVSETWRLIFVRL